MIKHIQHSAIDKGRWDQCVDQADNKMIYAKSWYLDIICPGWNALILDNYKAVMPIPWKSKLGIKYVYQPWLSQQLGVFPNNISLDINDIIQALKTHYHLVQVCFTSGVKLNSRFGNITSKHNLILPLTREYADISASYKKNHVRNCRKAHNSGMEFTDQVTRAEILNLFHQTQLEKKVGWKKQHLKQISDLMDTLIPKGNGIILGAKFNGNLIAAVFLLIDNPRITYLFPVSTDEGYTKLAQFFLVDQIIQKYSGKELILDFEGSSVEGIRKFYKGFGAGKEKLYLAKISRNKILDHLSSAFLK